MLPQCASCPISCVESSTRATRARSVQSTSSFLSCCAAALTSSTCSRSVYQHVWHLVCLVDSRTRARALAVPLSWCALSRALQLSRILSLPQALPLFMLCPSLPLCPTLALSYSLADYAKTGISCAQTTTNRRHLLCDALFAVAVNVAASLSCCSPWGEHKANCAQQNQSSSEKVVSVVAE